MLSVKPKKPQPSSKCSAMSETGQTEKDRDPRKRGQSTPNCGNIYGRSAHAVSDQPLRRAATQLAASGPEQGVIMITGRCHARKNPPPTPARSRRLTIGSLYHGFAMLQRLAARCSQHKQHIIDPPSIIKLFQEHPSDIPLVDTVEAIRMQEEVALLIRACMHVVALTQNHPGEHGEAGCVQHGF